MIDFDKDMESIVRDYQEGHITLGEAVLLAKTDYWTMLDILNSKGIAANIDEEDHLGEIARIKKEEYKKFL